MSHRSLSFCKRRSLDGLNSEMHCTIDGEEIHCCATEMVQKHILGHGAFGSVFEMVHKPTNKIMAVKKLKFITSDPEKQKGLFRDLNISKEANSQYTVRFYGALLYEGDVWICMERMDLSLDTFYLQVKELDKKIPEAFIAKAALSVVSGLKYLKDELKIIHRDVKPSNILLNSDGYVRICDFGISGPLIDSVAQSKDVGCREYMAPERIDPKQSSQDYDIRSDVWSLGITLVEVATGDYPYKLLNSPFELIQQIVNDDPPKLPKGFSLNFENFINRCLEKKPHNRPKYKDLIKHSFLEHGKRFSFDMKKYSGEIIDVYKKQPNIFETECL